MKEKNIETGSGDKTNKDNLGKIRERVHRYKKIIAGLKDSLGDEITENDINIIKEINEKIEKLQKEIEEWGKN